MNSLEAKFILEACRSGELDANDPKIAEAMQAMESDPAVARWFADAQELDRAVTAKLRAIPVPEDLLARIRAGEAPAPARRPAMTRRRWLAVAAAGVAVGAPAAFFLTRPSPGNLAAFRHDMAAFMGGWDFTFDLDEIHFTVIRDWLRSREMFEQLTVPPTLAASNTIGCKTLRWRGNPAVLICFSPREVGATVHLFAVGRPAVIDPPTDSPVPMKLPAWNSSAWADENHVYLALTTAEPEKLKHCL